MKLVKSLIAAGAAIALPAFAFATSLTLTVEGIESPTGTLMVGVYSADTYNGGDAVNGATISVDAEAETVTIDGLAPGEYGIKIFHDVDDDGQMDTNPFGMPTEPYAFSNNAKGRFGPATWDDAKFTVSEDGASQTIALN